MNYFKFSPLLVLFASGVVITPLASFPAHASCVMTDISLQVAIRGSKTPSNQNNNVSMGSSDNCWGNNVTNTSTQLYIGSGTANQNRNSQLFVGGDSNSSPFPGMPTPTIKTQISVPVDVYSPAHDPNLMNSLGIPFQP